MFFGAVLLVLDAVSKRRMETVQLSLGLEDVGAAVPAAKALHPEARFLSLEQDPSSQAGTVLIELLVPAQSDGFELLQGLRKGSPESSARPSIPGEDMAPSRVTCRVLREGAQEVACSRS